MINKLKTFFKHFFLINDSPHKVSGGAALGIFLGITPGEGLAATLVLSSLFRLNRLSATAGVLATNMWATVIVLPAAAIVGGFLFNTNARGLAADFEKNYHLGWEFLLSEAVIFNIALPLFVGFVIVDGIIALSFYFLLLYLLKNKKIKLHKDNSC